MSQMCAYIFPEEAAEQRGGYGLQCHNLTGRGSAWCYWHDPRRAFEGRRGRLALKRMERRLVADHRQRLADRGLPLRRLPTPEESGMEVIR